MIEFHILKKSKISSARIGILKTPHGEIETPTFVPVATQAVIKTLTSEEVQETKSQILIVNTFHLHLKPGEKIIKFSGGLHKFMNWSKPLMTDSGGFQVFSLGFGRDLGVGKIINSDTNTRIYSNGTNKKSFLIKHGQQPKSIRITNDGVYFQSPLDGKKLFIGPRESIKIQEALGADIIFAFDECPPPNASVKYVAGSLKKTHHWAKICLDIKKSQQSLFGIVQGSKFKNLRIQSAKFIGSLDFDGFGIGGEFGENKKMMEQVIGWVKKELPENKPIHLLGIGHLEDLLQIIKAGIDLFDCIAPTHYGRRGIAFTSSGRLTLEKSIFLKDKEPLDKNCDCFVCQNYKRNYICHLLRAKEITALKLLTFHNLYFFNSCVEEIRNQIKKGKI